jgi:transcriptional regulator with XRE-family HTH domain
LSIGKNNKSNIIMKLAEYLEKNHLSAVEFARSLKISSQRVGAYVRGERIPRPAMLQRIIKATNQQVTANDFYA